jgi:peptide/nickel transport system permease protein
MGILRYMRKRLFFILPQILGVVTITFLLVRSIPADPARLMMGTQVPEEGVQLMREKLGLTGSIPEQYVRYLKSLLRGDLGRSWVTGNTVITDVKRRLPATLELIIYALLLVFFIMLPIAFKAMSRGTGLAKRVARKVLFSYGMAAGAFPDFWLSLILIFLFYNVLNWVPAPVGRLSLGVMPPDTITGMYLVDSLLTQNWEALISSAQHLILPVFVLAFVYGGGICKVAIVSAMDLHKSSFIDFMKVSGLPGSIMDRYVKHASYPNVAVLSAINFGFLLGGAVLVETVFSWNGFGRYAVQSITNADFSAIQGVVLIAGILNLLVYGLVDLVYYFIDPRLRSVS